MSFPVAIDKFPKDVQAIVDYSINWGNGELEEGDEITSSSWSVVPSGTLAIDSDTFTATVATVVTSAGDAGTTYLLTNRIGTLLGKQDDRTIAIQVNER